MAYCYGDGRRAVFRRRGSNEVVGEFTQSFLSGGCSKFAVVLADYSEMDAEQFERLWLSK